MAICTRQLPRPALHNPQTQATSSVKRSRHQTHNHHPLQHLRRPATPRKRIHTPTHTSHKQQNTTTRTLKPTQRLHTRQRRSNSLPPRHKPKRRNLRRSNTTHQQPQRNSQTLRNRSPRLPRTPNRYTTLLLLLAARMETTQRSTQTHQKRHPVTTPEGEDAHPTSTQ